VVVEVRGEHLLIANDATTRLLAFYTNV